MDRHTDDASQGFLAALARLAPEEGCEQITLGDIVDRLDERAYGLLLLVLALPCLVPGLPGAQILAALILLLSLQLAAGRSEPWFPGRVLRAGVPAGAMRRAIAFAQNRLAFVERISRPRLPAFSAGAGERLAGIAVSVAALAVMLPITNTVPSLAITLIAVGLIQRDGVLCLAGVVVAALWACALAAAGFGLVTGADWIAGRLSA